VLIENHSPLHDDKGHPFFKEGRDYDDDLKMQAVDAGGKLEGWSYAVVRWSEEEIDQVLRRPGTQSAALMEDLDTALARQRYAASATPLRLPNRSPPTVMEFIREHSDLRRHVEIVESRDLIYQDNQFWAGSKSLYAYRCASCGYEDRMSAWSVEDRSAPCLSCGERQTWEGFVYACDKAGYPVVEPSVKIDTRVQVTLRCRKHQAPISLVRSRVAKKLKSDPKRLCVSCTQELPNPVRHRPGDGQTWGDFVKLMDAHGWDVPDQDWRGTSISEARGGGIQKYRIVHRECGNEKDVGIFQARQDLEERRGYGCDHCKVTARYRAMVKLASLCEFELAEDETVPKTSEKMTMLCKRSGCPRDGTYSVSFDNLRRKGPACRACREHLDLEFPISNDLVRS
jgi:hypothetical protein